MSKKYILKSWTIGWFKLSLAFLGNKFSIRFSIEKGWE